MLVLKREFCELPKAFLITKAIYNLDQTREVYISKKPYAYGCVLMEIR